MKDQTVGFVVLTAVAVCAFAARGEVNWDEARIMGTTPGGKMFYAPGEEMAFTLKLENVKGALPPDTYFIDWTRTGDDGKKDGGRVPAACAEPLVIRTSLAQPGFVKIEANVVTKDGKRVPKDHRWEKRVFFQGGAGVEPDKLTSAPEPDDFDAWWEKQRSLLKETPLDVQEKSPIPCGNPEMNLYKLRLSPTAGFRAATAYLSVPKAASSSKRFPVRFFFDGYGHNTSARPYAPMTNRADAIWFYVNQHGYELGRDEGYYADFYKQIEPHGKTYSCDPEENKSRETAYLRGMFLRDLRMIEYAKMLPEWNGVDLVMTGGSGGGMQSLCMAGIDRDISAVDVGIPCFCDLGGETFGRLTGFRPVTKYTPEIAYFDPVNHAKRIACPVKINAAGMGDYTCPPSTLSVLYNNLRVPKSIRWSQGCTHGWWPAGVQTFEQRDAGPAEKPVDWQAVNAAAAKNYLHALRPGEPGTAPFWNEHARQYLYPPAFDFKEAPNAAAYRFTLTPERTKKDIVFTSDRPWRPLVPVWEKLPVGYCTLRVDALGGDGSVLKRAGETRFWRAAPFKGPYPKGAASYRTAAAKVYKNIFEQPYVQAWKKSSEMPSGYSLYCYPSKILPGVIDAVLKHGARENEAVRGDALLIARHAADWLVAHAQAADTPLAHFTPTYFGKVCTSVSTKGETMLLYPAHAASALVRVYEATGDARYRDAAVGIGRTYLRLQRPEGTWYLKVREEDGSPVKDNLIVPDFGFTVFFADMKKLTGDAAFGAAADRAWRYVENGPFRSWNWEGQFEDVDPSQPYRNLERGKACDFASRLFAQGRLEEGRLLADWCEDQFTVWSDPIPMPPSKLTPSTDETWNTEWKLPAALEQYGFYTPIDASAASMIFVFTRAYAATHEPFYREEAKALADALVRYQKPDGLIQTHLSRLGDVFFKGAWMNCMVYSAAALEALADTLGEKE